MQNAAQWIVFILSYSCLDAAFGQNSLSQLSPVPFQKVKTEVYTHIANPDGKLENKQALRTLHYLRDRTDANGNVINTMAANLEALQQLYIDTLSNNITGNWQMLGPNFINETFLAGGEGAGRVNCIAFASAATWYVGTAGGGLWKTTSAGIYVPGLPYPWTPMTDSLPVNSVSGVVVNPLDTSEVYILTGDGDGSGVTLWGGAGIGILKSSNGGITWSGTSLTFSTNSLTKGYKLIAHPDDPDIMFAATNGGLYMTTDGWSTPPDQVISDICFDMEFHPTNPDIMYAVGKNWLRRSEDGGSTFSNAGVGNFNDTNASQSGRIAIAVTPNLPDALYAILVDDDTRGLLSLQFSNDTCNNFAEILDESYNILSGDDPTADSTGQGDYDLAIWADPDNYLHIIVGGIDLWGSDGITWGKLTDWTSSGDDYIHADVHMLEHNPYNGDLIVGTDGGISVSEDNGVSWSTRSKGLAITELYHFDIRVSSLGLPTVGGGAQDNGSSYWFSGTNGQFNKITGGDGFRIYSGDNGENFVRYTCIQNGKIMRYDIDYDINIPEPTEITPDQVIGSDDKPIGAWDTPYAPSANNIDELIAGYRHLYYNADGDDDWQQLEVDGYSSDDRIMEIEWGNSNPNVFYFLMMDGTENSFDSIALFSHLWRVGNLYAAIVTDNLSNGNLSLMVLDTLLQNMLVTDLEENPNDPDELWITVGGYADSVKVFHNPNTVDSPFVNISYNLPNVPVHCAEYDEDGIYVGTEIGVFFMHHGDTIWQYHSLGLATVPVTGLEIAFFPWGKQIWAGTYGRGIWFSDPPAPLRRTRWYVDDTATGANDGSNWTDAFPDLQTALDTVYPGDSIWVATGTYLPQTSSGFSLIEHHMYIWGGFAGTEDSVSQRDFVVNPTILSGDIGVPGDSLDNAHHVFAFSGVNDGVLLDGFHITGGYAHNSGSNSRGGGIYYETGTATGKPLIRNCQVYNNSSAGIGGAIFIGDYAKGDPAFNLANCAFENNRATGNGGTIYLDSSPSIIPDEAGYLAFGIDSCTFIGSKGQSGGAICTEANYTGTVDLTITNSMFTNNRATGGNSNNDGGSIHCDSQVNGKTYFRAENTTFYDSRTNGTNSGGAVYFYHRGDSLSAEFIECTFDSCYSYYGGSIEFDGLNSIYSSNIDSCTFTESQGVWGGAIRYRASLNKRVESNLRKCLFNNNTSTNRGGSIHYDADGAGWYDVSIDTCTFSNSSGGSGGGAISFFIRENGSGTQPGKLNLTGTGSAFESNSATHSGAIWLYMKNSEVSVNLEATDFLNNTSSNVAGAFRAEHTPGNHTDVDLTFTDCNFENNSSTQSGGAIYLVSTDAVFDGCTFIQNSTPGGSASTGGGAIRIQDHNYADTFSHAFYQCVFDSNSALFGGGAILLSPDAISVMQVTIDSCTFDGNYTTYPTWSAGGAIRSVDEGRLQCNITNSEFTGNHTQGSGGAISVYSNKSDTINLDVSDCTFSDNMSVESGTAVQLHKYQPGLIQSTWTDCTFYTNENARVFHNYSQLSGTSLARFHDCYIYYNTQPGPVNLQGLVPPGTN